MPAEDRPRGDCRGTSGLREARKPPDRDSQAPPLAPRQEAAPGTKWLLRGEAFQSTPTPQEGVCAPKPSPSQGAAEAWTTVAGRWARAACGHLHARAPLGGELAVEHHDDALAVGRGDGLLEQEVLHLVLHVQVHGALRRHSSAPPHAGPHCARTARTAWGVLRVNVGTFKSHRQRQTGTVFLKHPHHISTQFHWLQD